MAIGIYDGLKDAAKVLQEAGKIEQYKEILGALEKLLEQQKYISDLESENKDLKTKLEVKASLFYSAENNSYVSEKTKGQQEGPFCSRCWDVDCKLVRLHTYRSTNRAACPNCDKTAIQGKAIVSYIG